MSVMSLTQKLNQSIADLIASEPKTTVAELRELAGQHPQLFAGVSLLDALGVNGGAKKPGRPKGSKAAEKPAKAAKKRGRPKGSKNKPAAEKAEKPAPKKGKKQKKAPPKAAKSESSGALDPRTREGRAKIDEAVHAELKALGAAVSNDQLREALDTKYGKDSLTTAQCRTALNRLITEKKVTYEGQARGTRYSAA